MPYGSTQTSFTPEFKGKEVDGITYERDEWVLSRLQVTAATGTQVWQEHLEHHKIEEDRERY